MRKEIVLLLLVVFLISLVSAANTCNIKTTIINQDPYPATPGDYVKVVFQLDGVNNIECTDSIFQIIPEYPFSLDTTQTASYNIKDVAYINSYKSTILIPIRLRVDKNALNGENILKTALSTLSSGKQYQLSNYNITVKDVRADFDVILQDYSYSTNKLVLGIINIGKNDAEALVVRVPEQSNTEIVGNSEKIIGSLAANDDTSVTFDAIPKSGEIKVELSYNDKLGVRRTFERTVTFLPRAFENTKSNGNQRGPYFYPFIILLIADIIFIIYRTYKNKQKRKLNK